MKPRRSRRARVPIRPSKYWGHPPSVKQAAFLSLPQLEAGYGGAAGGGKSDALLMAALQYVDIRGYKALILRKTFSDLSQADGLLDRSHEWLQGRADWNEGKHRWTFGSGALLEFGHMQYSKDRFSYQGAAYDFVGYDELSHFERADYIYLFSRMRQRVNVGIPVRMRAAFNPPENPHDHWITNRFIDKKPDEENPNETEEDRRNRIFIHATLDDNPGIDQEGYDASLKMLDEQTYKQLRFGDFRVRQPGNWVFDHDHIDAAEELGRRFDELLAAGKMTAPVKSLLCSGMDYGDLATVFEPIWPLERGGIYVPPGESASSREDLEEIAAKAIGIMGNYRWWWASHRYDASFAQSNRTFAAIVQRELGAHNAIRKRGRPDTYPVAFGSYKDLSIRYLRLLMRRAHLYVNDLVDETTGKKADGTRVLAISPTAALLLKQARGYKEDDFGKPEKGDDDAVDALIAGVTPEARKHRAAVDAATAEAKKHAAAQAKKQILPSQVG